MYITTDWTVTPGTFDPIELLTNLEVQALDVVTHVASSGDSDVECVLAPIAATTDCHFVLITSSSYLAETPPTYDITYKVDENTSQAIELDTWHLWSRGMDEGLGAGGLKFDSIFVSNGHSATDATLTVYVGRNS